MTLTEVSYYSRKLLPFAVIGMLVLLILFYAVKLLFLVLQGPQVQQTYINPVFNKITPPRISNASGSAGLNFTLDTIEGEPVTASQTAKVFYIPPTATRFGYKEKAYLMAQTLGFNTETMKYELKQTQAVMSDPLQTLTVDISNFNFLYEFRFERNQALFQGLTIPAETDITNKAIDFLKSVNRYPDELAQGKTNIVYLNYDPIANSMTRADRAQDANMVEVDFFRPDIDGFSTVTSKFPNSQNFVLMIFKNQDFKILRAQVNFFEKSTDQVGVYPLRSGALAWSELKEGKGIVLSGDQNQKNVTIKTMFTAYYDPDTYQDYLEPVYVFLGTNNFYAIIPAVDSGYLTK